MENKDFNFKKAILILILLIIAIPFITFSVLKFNKNLSKNNATTQDTSSPNIKNFLLLGTDGREGEQSFRSDCMIIATMDLKHKSIKLT